MDLFLRFLPISSFFLLLIIWIYFFIYSHWHRIGYPWGYSIVFTVIFIPRLNIITFQFGDYSLFSIDPWFVLTFIWVFFNINDIQKQIAITDIKKFLYQCLAGIILGILSLILFTTALEKEIILGIPNHITFAFLIERLQISAAEELLFRGYLLGYFLKYRINPFIAIILQALFFTGLHIPIYRDNWAILIIIFIIGIFTGSITWKSNNLIPAILIHIIVNMFLVI